MKAFILTGHNSIKVICMYVFVLFCIMYFFVSNLDHDYADNVWNYVTPFLHLFQRKQQHTVAVTIPTSTAQYWQVDPD